MSVAASDISRPGGGGGTAGQLQRLTLWQQQVAASRADGGGSGADTDMAGSFSLGVNPLAASGVNTQQGDMSGEGEWGEKASGRFLLHVFSLADLERVVSHSVLGHQGVGRYNISENPLFVVPARGRLRKFCVGIIDHRHFDTVILVLVIVNCLVEILEEPSVKDMDWASSLRFWSEIVFLSAFAMEAMLKICALGFVLHRRSYLRSYWNCLDFAILVMSFAVIASKQGGSFSVLRLVRAIRPLRALRRTSGVKILILAITKALPVIVDVLALLLVITFMFAVLGVQLWMGVMHQRCYAYPDAAQFPYLASIGMPYTAADVTTPLLMKADTAPCGGGRSCPDVPGYITRCEVHKELFQSDVSNFDHLGTATFQVLRVVTLDDWPDEMFDVQDASTSWAVFYFVILTLVGGYFLLHMVVSVLTVSFADASRTVAGVRHLVVNPQGMGCVPMGTGVYAHVRPRYRKPFQSRLHLINEHEAMCQSEEKKDRDGADPYANPYSQNRLKSGAELTLQKYFGVHKYLEEYRLDMEQKKKKQAAQESASQHIQQLKEVLEDGDAPQAISHTEDRRIPNTLRVDNLIGLDVMHMMIAVACPLAMIPDTAPNLDDTISNVSSEVYDHEDVSRVRMLCRRVVLTPLFSYVMLVVTAFCVISLATDYDGISDEHSLAIDLIQYIGMAFFVVEFLLKIVGLGFKSFVSDWLNIVDTLVLVLCLPEIFYRGVGISALRGFRALRLLAFMSEAQKEMLSAIGRALPDLVSLMVLLFIFVFMYSLLGLSLFEGQFPTTSRETFNSLWESALTVFIMIAGDGWSPITKTAVQSTTAWAVVFFALLFFFGTIVIMSMFPALLIDRMTSALRSKKKRAQQDALRQLEALGVTRNPAGLSRAILDQREKALDAEAQAEQSGWVAHDWTRVQRGTVLNLLGNWRAEISVKKGRPFWVNRLSGKKVWENPVVVEDDVPIVDAECGQKVEVWHAGVWAAGVVLGRRNNGSYAVAVKVAGETTTRVGVHPSFLRRPRERTGDPLSRNHDERFGAAHKMLRRKSLLDAYNHPDMGGFMLLWCGLTAKSKKKLEQLWENAGQRDVLLHHLSKDGTLTPCPQPYHDEDQNAAEPRAPGSDEPTNPIDREFTGVAPGGRGAKHPQVVSEPSSPKGVLQKTKTGSMSKRKKHLKVHVMVPETGQLRKVEYLHWQNGGTIDSVVPEGIGGTAKLVCQEPLQMYAMSEGPGQSTRSCGSVYNGSDRGPKKNTRLGAMKLRSAKAPKLRRTYSLEDPHLRISDRSLGFFSRTNKIRKVLSVVIFHKWFDDGMLVVIAVNAVFLGLDDYYAPRRPGGTQLLDTMNVIFVVIYLAEMVAKVIVLGLWKAPHAYFRGTWNKVDAVVALSQILELTNIGVGNQLRGARTIRLLVRWPELRVVCEMLIKVLPDIFKVFLVYGLVWVIFGVIGVATFKGQLHYCTDRDTISKVDCAGPFFSPEAHLTDNLHPPVASERQWHNSRVNFDNIFASFMLLLELSSGEGWRELMFKTVDATGVDVGPQRNENPHRALYFVVYMLIGHFMLAGLLVGTLANGFFASEHNQSRFLTVKQRNWVRMQRIISRYDLEWRARMPMMNEWNGIKLLCYKMNKDARFDAFIYIAIFVNCCFLATTYDSMSDSHSRVLHVANIIFIVIFILEALVRFAALGFQGYMRDPWNRFDLLCITLSVVGLILAVNTTVARVARGVRGVRLLRKANKLKQIILTLHRCLPALLNVSLLLLYIFFNWGLVGVSVCLRESQKIIIRIKYNNKNTTKSPTYLFPSTTHTLYLADVQEREAEPESQQTRELQDTAGGRANPVPGQHHGDVGGRDAGHGPESA